MIPDMNLLLFYTGLPTHLEDSATLQKYRQRAIDSYPYNGEQIDHAIVISDAHRSLWNQYKNRLEFSQRLTENKKSWIVTCEKDKNGNPKENRGAYMKQYDMYMWPGIEVIGCVRKDKSDILNGCIYIVKDVDEHEVTFSLHDDYNIHTKFDKPETQKALERFVPDVVNLLQRGPKTPHSLEQRNTNLDLKVALKQHIWGVSISDRWYAFAHIFNTTFELYGNCLRLREQGDDAEDEKPNVVKLNYKDTCASVRLTYGLCYYSAQGTTIRDKHVVLFDCFNQYFTLRNLNVGMSRVTHGSYIHVLTKKQQDRILAPTRAL